MMNNHSKLVIYLLLLTCLAAPALVTAQAQGRVETVREPGLTDAGVEVGVVMPTAGPLAETGASMRAILTAYFEEVNARGGVHNRKVTLRFFDTPAAARQSAVFAYVGGITAGSDAELSRLAREQGAPFVGPATLMPDTATPLNRYVFYFLPGVAEQARSSKRRRRWAGRRDSS